MGARLEGVRVSDSLEGWVRGGGRPAGPVKARRFKIASLTTTAIRVSLCIPTFEPPPLSSFHYACHDAFSHTPESRMRQTASSDECEGSFQNQNDVQNNAQANPQACGDAT